MNRFWRAVVIGGAGFVLLMAALSFAAILTDRTLTTTDRLWAMVGIVFCVAAVAGIGAAIVHDVPKDGDRA